LSTESTTRRLSKINGSSAERIPYRTNWRKPPSTVSRAGYATHKHAKVKRWLAQHKRFHVHFTPTSFSWLNMVEGFFRDLTQNHIRRGIFKDIEQLIMGIGDYIDGHNQNPKPFIWTAKACDILAKVSRAKIARNKRLSV
jgi:transposase